MKKKKKKETLGTCQYFKRAVSDYLYYFFFLKNTHPNEHINYKYKTIVLFPIYFKMPMPVW